MNNLKHTVSGLDPITDFIITNLLCVVFGSLAGFAIAVMMF